MQGENVVAGIVANNLPKWFAHRYASSLMPPWVLEVTISHRMPFQSQVECVNLSHSFICCSDLLHVIALICWDDQSDNKLLTVWRKNNELMFKRFRLTKVDFPFEIPPISFVEAMKEEEKRKLLFNIILNESGESIQQQPSELQLIFASVVHWARKSQCRVRSYHIDGLVASLLHFYVIERKLGKLRTTKRLEKIANAKGGTGVDDYINAAKSTFKFQETDIRMLSHDTNYDKDIVHVLAEFQATYYLAQTLCQILDVGLPNLSPADFYCGSFTYQAVSHFKGYNRLTLAEKLYGNPESPLFSLFRSYTNYIYELTPPSLMEWAPHGPYKPRNKRIKKPNQPQAVAQPCPSSSSSSEEESNEFDANLIANRFGVLSVA